MPFGESRRNGWLEAAASLRRLVNGGDEELSEDAEARLVHNMSVLQNGLALISRWFEHVDPTVGAEGTRDAGSFVLSSAGDRRARFVIDERYAGTDSSDPDRRAVAWDWRVEKLTPRRDAPARWSASSGGRFGSDEVGSLVEYAEAWARRVNQTAQWTQSLGRPPGASQERAQEFGGL